jgi:hypothetical protein
MSHSLTDYFGLCLRDVNQFIKIVTMVSSIEVTVFKSERTELN